MRLLHTSDWHLGHTLHEWPRLHEHQAFLDWLIETAVRERIDALVVTGDIFETGNPPADAQHAFYDFLARIRRRLPLMGLVIIGGNHDSAARLDAPNPLFRAFDVHIVGGLPKGDAGLDFDRLLIRLNGPQNSPGLLIAAVPYLRNADLPPVDLAAGDPLIEGVRRVYTQVLDEARRRLLPGETLVVTGHLFMKGGSTSDLSERKILGGNQHGLPSDIFGDVAYVALGHLHWPQIVGGDDHIRYAGSPLPLSMAEANYPSQVVVVDLDNGRFQGARAIHIPRLVDMVRVPREGPAPLELILPRLVTLPYDDLSVPPELRPFLDVRVRVEAADPTIRQNVERALANKAVRLVGLHIEAVERSPGEHTPGTLHDLTPEEVFRRRYAVDHSDEPPADLLSCFHDLVQAVAEERP